VGPQVRFCERLGGAIPRAYSAGSGPLRCEFVRCQIAEGTVRAMLVVFLTMSGCQFLRRSQAAKFFQS
jgi:hypothetical protein